MAVSVSHAVLPCTCVAMLMCRRLHVPEPYLPPRPVFASHSLKKAEEERMRDALDSASREKKEKKDKKKDKEKK